MSDDQRDGGDLPEGDPQDVAEALDLDELDDGAGPLGRPGPARRRAGEDELGWSPPDRPSAVDDADVTPLGEQFDEPLAVRVTWEEPDADTGGGPRRPAGFRRARHHPHRSRLDADEALDDGLLTEPDPDQQAAEELAMHVEEP